MPSSFTPCTDCASRVTFLRCANQASSLHADDLAVLLGMQQKDLRKLCGRLREDRMLAVASRVESRDGIQRAVPREYYYIPLHTVVDMIKYKVHKVTQQVSSQYTPSTERKDYICRKCGSSWTQMEVLDNVGPEGFECHKCGALLYRAEGADGTTSGAGHEKQAKLMNQLAPMIDLLQAIDRTEVPPNSFEEAWDRKKDIKRDKTNPARPSVPVGGSGITVAKSGTRNNESDADQLTVNITTGAEKSKAELLEEEDKKAKLAKQNALPVWHTQSTVTGSSFVGTEEGKEVNGAFNRAEAAQSHEKKADIAADDELDQYYAEMAAEKEREAAALAAESSEDDEEEGDFEDVGPSTGTGTPAAIGTPSFSQPTANGVSGLKRELESDSGSSPNTTNAPTPADDGTEKDVKRVKLEEPVEMKPDTAKEEDSEEDFEDVA